MIGDIKLHHVAAQLTNFIGLSFDFHARFYISGAGGWESTAAFNFYEANAARAKGFKLVGGTEARDFYPALGGSAHYRGTFWHCDANAINTQSHHGGAGAFWGAVICLGFVEFQHAIYLPYQRR